MFHDWKDLSSEHMHIRQKAVNKLGKIGEISGFLHQEVIKALKDPSQYVYNTAAKYERMYDLFLNHWSILTSQSRNW